jgi:hypothetical protein
MLGTDARQRCACNLTNLMEKTRLFIFSAVAAALFTACGEQPAANNANTAVTNTAVTNTNTNVNANKAASSGTVPTADMLINFDKLWHEAYTNGNAAFFEGVLADKFVMLADDGTRLDKAGALKAIGAVKCALTSRDLTEPVRTVIDADTYAVSYKATFAGTCNLGPGGATIKRPSPVRAATVWVRAPGDNWKVAFHGENLIAAAGTAPKAVAAAKPADGKAPAAEPVTDALMAAERSLWEAWKDHDRGRLDALTAAETGFVNIFGTAFGTKADTLKDWTGPGCSVKSVSLTDGSGLSLSPSLAVLTLKGTADGTCSGQRIGPVLGTSFYVKEGDAWKWAFGFNAPAP